MPGEKVNSATQVFDSRGSVTLISGSLPETAPLLGVEESVYAIDTETIYIRKIDTENFSRLKALLPEEEIKRRLIESKHDKPSYCQGIIDCENLTFTPFQYSLLKSSNNDYSKPPERNPLICQLSLVFLNNQNELCGFSIQKVKDGDQYHSNVAVLSNVDKTPSARNLTFRSSVEMLPPWSSSVENTAKSQKVFTQDINQTIRSAINSDKFHHHINLDRLLENTADSFEYLKAINGCFVEVEIQPNYDNLIQIYHRSFLVEQQVVFDSPDTLLAKISKIIPENYDLEDYVNIPLLKGESEDAFNYRQKVNAICFPKQIPGQPEVKVDWEELKKLWETSPKEPIISDSYLTMLYDETPLLAKPPESPHLNIPEKILSLITNMFRFVMENPHMALGVLAVIAVTIMIVLTYGTAAGVLGAGITAGALAPSSIEAAAVGVGVVAGAALGVAGLGAAIRHKFFKPEGEPEALGRDKPVETPSPPK